MVGRPYLKATGAAHTSPLIRLRQRHPPALSFWNLIEAHVLRALRTDYGVSVQHLRKAVAFAQKELSIDRLLLNQELRTTGGRLLLERYGELMELSAPGSSRCARRSKRTSNGSNGISGAFPFACTRSSRVTWKAANRPIAIDSAIAFGRPVIVRASVTTQTVSERIDAGESVDDLARDYDLTSKEIEEAVLYERAA